MGTINRDLTILRQQSKENIRKYVDEKLPEEYEKCLVGLNAILKESWLTAQKAQSERDKLHALNLAKECYAMKMDMLTNATVIDDAIRFIAANSGAGSSQGRSKELKEKAKSYGLDKGDIDDLSRSEKESITESTTATNNKTF